jgi:hypothetical protein
VSTVAPRPTARALAATRALDSLPAEGVERYLLEHSDLPGPRANLELLSVAVERLPASVLRAFASMSPREAPSGTAREFLPTVGVAGLGRLLAEAPDEAARRATLDQLAAHAADPRWRVREAAAIALQRWGSVDIRPLLAELRGWTGAADRFRQRAAVAAICEPPLLRRPDAAAAALDLLDMITRTLPGAADRRTEPFRVLRQALGYGWSVAVVALPAEGRKRLEAWLLLEDPDVRWVVRENLRKARLTRMDAAWSARMAQRATTGA